MDLPIKNGDFPVRYVKLPEGIQMVRLVTSIAKAKEDSLFRDKHTWFSEDEQEYTVIIYRK